MKRGELVIARVEGLSLQGEGIARLEGEEGEGREVLVPRAVPGDRVEARVRGKHRGRLVALPERFLEQAIQRQAPPCQHFGVCGGCRFQDLAYPDQLRLKEQVVREAVEGGGARVGQWRPILASPRELRYRNKMEFSFGTGPDGALQLGLHRRGRFDRVFDVEACHLQPELADRILGAVRRHARQGGLPAYDLQTHEGLLRFLVIRHSAGRPGVMVDLVVAEYPCAGVAELAARVLEEFPQITTFVVTLHRGRAQVAAGQEEFVLKGPGWIAEECGGLEFAISPRSFFQTNTHQAERLCGLVGELAGDLRGLAVLDLYCGTGGLSLHLARAARSVLGVELLPQAVEDARRNAAANGVGNCAFRAGPAEDILQELQAAGERFDRVVADPPRAGMHQRVLAALSALRPPVVVCVSCNPLSLAGDLAALQEAGYFAEVLQPIDMFPQTPHCEVVARLLLAD